MPGEPEESDNKKEPAEDSMEEKIKTEKTAGNQKDEPVKDSTSSWNTTAPAFTPRSSVPPKISTEKVCAKQVVEGNNKATNYQPTAHTNQNIPQHGPVMYQNNGHGQMYLCPGPHHASYPVYQGGMPYDPSHGALMVYQPQGHQAIPGNNKTVNGPPNMQNRGQPAPAGHHINYAPQSVPPSNMHPAPVPPLLPAATAKNGYRPGGHPQYPQGSYNPQQMMSTKTYHNSGGAQPPQQNVAYHNQQNQNPTMNANQHNNNIYQQNTVCKQSPQNGSKDCENVRVEVQTVLVELTGYDQYGQPIYRNVHDRSETKTYSGKSKPAQTNYGQLQNCSPVGKNPQHQHPNHLGGAQQHGTQPQTHNVPIPLMENQIMVPNPAHQQNFPPQKMVGSPPEVFQDIPAEVRKVLPYPQAVDENIRFLLKLNGYHMNQIAFLTEKLKGYEDRDCQMWDMKKCTVSTVDKKPHNVHNFQQTWKQSEQTETKVMIPLNSGQLASDLLTPDSSVSENPAFENIAHNKAVADTKEASVKKEESEPVERKELLEDPAILSVQDVVPEKVTTGVEVPKADQSAVAIALDKVEEKQVAPIQDVKIVSQESTLPSTETDYCEKGVEKIPTAGAQGTMQTVTSDAPNQTFVEKDIISAPENKMESPKAVHAAQKLIEKSVASEVEPIQMNKTEDTETRQTSTTPSTSDKIVKKLDPIHANKMPTQKVAAQKATLVQNFIEKSVASEPVQANKPAIQQTVKAPTLSNEVIEKNENQKKCKPNAVASPEISARKSFAEAVSAQKPEEKNMLNSDDPKQIMMVLPKSDCTVHKKEEASKVAVPIVEKSCDIPIKNTFTALAEIEKEEETIGEPSVEKNENAQNNKEKKLSSTNYQSKKKQKASRQKKLVEKSKKTSPQENANVFNDSADWMSIEPTSSSNGKKVQGKRSKAPVQQKSNTKNDTESKPDAQLTVNQRPKKNKVNKTETGEKPEKKEVESENHVCEEPNCSPVFVPAKPVSTGNHVMSNESESQPSDEPSTSNKNSNEKMKIVNLPISTKFTISSNSAFTEFVAKMEETIQEVTKSQNIPSVKHMFAPFHLLFEDGENVELTVETNLPSTSTASQIVYDVIEPLPDYNQPECSNKKEIEKKTKQSKKEKAEEDDSVIRRFSLSETKLRNASSRSITIAVEFYFTTIKRIRTTFLSLKKTRPDLHMLQELIIQYWEQKMPGAIGYRHDLELCEDRATERSEFYKKSGSHEFWCMHRFYEEINKLMNDEHTEAIVVSDLMYIFNANLNEYNQQLLDKQFYQMIMTFPEWKPKSLPEDICSVEDFALNPIQLNPHPLSCFAKHINIQHLLTNDYDYRAEDLTDLDDHVATMFAEHVDIIVEWSPQRTMDFFRTKIVVYEAKDNKTDLEQFYLQFYKFLVNIKSSIVDFDVFWYYFSMTTKKQPGEEYLLLNDLSFFRLLFGSEDKWDQ